MRTVIAVGLLIAFAAAGCGEPETKGGKKQVRRARAEGHEHGAGPHKGAVGDFGDDHHVEFTVDHNKKEARVYILDGDARKDAPVKAKDGRLKAAITGLKTRDTFEVVLKADKEGAASCYVGTHEKLAVEQEFEGTVTGEVGGKELKGEFKEEPE